MKKEIMIHFRWRPYLTDLSACGADLRHRSDLKITSVRKRVTCKRCKNTKTFRKIK